MSGDLSLSLVPDSSVILRTRQIQIIIIISIITTIIKVTRQWDRKSNIVLLTFNPVI